MGQNTGVQAAVPVQGQAVQRFYIGFNNEKKALETDGLALTPSLHYQLENWEGYLVLRAPVF